MYEARFRAGPFAAGAGSDKGFGAQQRERFRGERDDNTTPNSTGLLCTIAAGDTESMVALMAPDVEWISVIDFHVQNRGPEEVMKKVFAPLMEEWESFSPAPSEFHADGSTVRSLGRFACVHRATHKRADVAYAHVLDIKNGRIERHRQYIHTLALEQIRNPSCADATA